MTDANTKCGIELLAAHLGISPCAVEVRQTTVRVWVNSCLECANPGEACVAVLIPGYRLVLRAKEQFWVVHTGGGCNPAASASSAANPFAPPTR